MDVKLTLSKVQNEKTESKLKIQSNSNNFIQLGKRYCRINKFRI